MDMENRRWLWREEESDMDLTPSFFDVLEGG